ncbi:hypothetical protein Q0590_28990 [Rhodocytophaga aerolata]|uniref:RDD family protein n=1 Tax=Rhodocytophaga aerolata TaxID=455078 RepID=A0ABT8RE06_9BACT|nr:hypothetical protein [Rhodocytophaga aerolata]MDO1450347.1 hypothetical protein [Rhodocytophaga aerolata]
MGQFWAELLTALLLLLLPLLFPHKSEESFRKFTPGEMELLKPQLNRYNWIAALVIVPVLTGCVFLATDFLYRLTKLIPFPRQQFEQAFPFMELCLIWPGMAFGFSLSLYFISAMMRRIMGRKYALLYEASSQQYGMDGKRVMNGLVLFGLFAGIITLLIGYDWYAGIKGDTLVINPLLDVREKHYSLQDITRLSYIDHRRTTQSRTDTLPYYEIAFKDGYVWDTKESLRYHMQNKDRPVMEYISQQIHLKIDTTTIVE